MAKKYIDADRLIEELKELESVIHSEQLVGQSMHSYDCGQLHTINIIKELINSLQQEEEWEGQRTWIEKPSEESEGLEKEYKDKDWGILQDMSIGEED